MYKMIPITDLQQKTKRYVQQVRDTGLPIIVTQRGRAAAILMSAEMYESYAAMMQVTAYPDWRHRMERAERDSKAGKGIELEEFVKREAKRRRRAS